MKHRSLICSLVGALAAVGFVVAPAAQAHHSFAAEYDQTKPLVLTGKLVRVVTENPHGWIYVEVRNANGKAITWQLETPGPNVLQKNGFTRDIFDVMVKGEEQVTITAYPAKDESKHGWAGGLTRADGQTVITLSGIPNQGGRGKGGPGGPPPQGRGQ